MSIVTLLLKQLAKRKANPNVTKAGRWPDRDHTPAGMGDLEAPPSRGALPTPGVRSMMPDLTEKEGMEKLIKLRKSPKNNYFMDPESGEIYSFVYGSGQNARGFYASAGSDAVQRIRANIFEIMSKKQMGPFKSQTANPAEIRPHPNYGDRSYYYSKNADRYEDLASKTKMYKKGAEQLLRGPGSAGTSKQATDLYMEEALEVLKDQKYNTGGPVKLMRMKYGY
tara:strand:- start:959 stop:1630 length:672 start_codon:yes stop_codon:yes gene_type:complete